MQITGMLHGARLLQLVGFPTAEVLGPDVSEGQIMDLIERYGQVFIGAPPPGGLIFLARMS